MIDRDNGAELILLNGEFRTQDPACPMAKAVAVAAGRIVATGDDDEVSQLSRSHTKVIDLNRRLGLPGMMDSHFHYFDWALGRRNLNLVDVKAFGELIARVARAAAERPQGTWILGHGWNENDWPENRMPTRDDLDDAAPAHPVALWRCDLHLVSVNSLALERAGISKKTGDMPDGAILYDPTGRPNGILREHACSLMKDCIPIPSENEILRSMRDGIPILHSQGLTGVHDNRLMGDVEGAPAFRAWQCLRDAGDLDLRCWVGFPGERLDEVVSKGLRTGIGDDRLRIGHLKYFADGSMGARTAWMLEPYLDADFGMPVTSMAELENAVQCADRAGLAVMIHAIGDRANREVVTIFEKLESTRHGDDKSAHAAPAISHRIEHVQMIRPEDLARLGRLNVVACAQPHNIILDITMIDASVGDRGKYAYILRDMLDAGVHLLLSSDAPVCDPSPLAGIHAAVTRRRPDGTPADGWYPSQRITVDEAVRGYTISPAAAYGLGHELGSITPGKRADLIILDKNIYTVPPMDIINANVDMTIFDGRIVYQRESL